MEMPRTAPRTGTYVFDPREQEQDRLRAWLHGWRALAVTRAVGRDVRWRAPLFVADWRLFARLDHLRELLLRQRGRVVVGFGLTAPSSVADALVTLRRHAGAVIRGPHGDAADLGARLQIPVAVAGGATSVAACLDRLVPGLTEDRGSVEAWLREAREYVQRGEDEGAFVAAARALAMAPDQPGILADVARLLARMGRIDEGQKLCRRYLLQRPESAPVQAALRELEPLA